MKKKARVKKRDKNKCLRCGSRSNLTVDHIVPKSKGGSSNDRNMQCLCYDCNHDKANTTINYKKIKKELLKEVVIILKQII